MKEREWIDEERRIRRRNRATFGWFRWRWHWDRLLTFLLRLLGRD